VIDLNGTVETVDFPQEVLPGSGLYGLFVAQGRDPHTSFSYVARTQLVAYPVQLRLLLFLLAQQRILELAEVTGNLVLVHLRQTLVLFQFRQ
jgi:hypothetical protein